MPHEKQLSCYQFSGLYRYIAHYGIEKSLPFSAIAATMIECTGVGDKTPKDVIYGHLQLSLPDTQRRRARKKQLHRFAIKTEGNKVRESVLIQYL